MLLKFEVLFILLCFKAIFDTPSYKLKALVLHNIPRQCIHFDEQPLQQLHKILRYWDDQALDDFNTLSQYNAISRFSIQQSSFF